MLIDVRPNRTVLSVFAHEPDGWMRQLLRTDRAYQAPPAVVTQVLCAALIAISGREDPEGIVQDVLELVEPAW